MDGAGLLHHVPLTGEALHVWQAVSPRTPPAQITFLPAEYVDDVALPVIAPAPDLLAACSKVLAIIWRTFCEHGLVVNCSKGKTEVLPVFAGKGSQEQQRLLDTSASQPSGASLPFRDGDANLSVCIVRAYKHVGTTTVVGSSLQAELSIRIASVRSATSGLKRGYFSCPEVTTARKLAVAQGVCTARGMFQAGTWPQLYSAEYRRFHTAIMHVFRQASGSCLLGASTSSPPLSDQRLFKEFGAPVPALLLVRARVYLLLRLLVRAPPELIALLALGARARRSWFASVRSDICTLFGIQGPLEQWSSDSFLQWLSAAAAQPVAMRRRIAQALAAPEARCLSLWFPTKSVSEIGERFVCNACSYLATSRQALAVHQFKKHGVVRGARAKVLVPWCPACLQLFGSRPRVLAHITEKSVRCRHFVDHFLEECDAHLVAEADAADAELARALVRAGRTRVAADTVVRRLEGPLCQGACAVGIDHRLLLGTQTSDAYF